MSVKIRLTRRGRKKLALYDVIVADARSPRDGRFIEKLGTYNPNTDPATIDINDDRAFHWVMVGAQPSDTVRAILSYRGIMLRKHLQVGVDKGAITQDQADKKFQDWLKEKSAKISAKVEGLSKAKSDDLKSRKEAEAKIKEARAEAIAKKNIVVEEVAETPATADEAPAEEAKAEETPVEEAKAEEASAEDAKAEEAPAEDAKAEEAPAEEVKAEEAPAEEAKAEEAPAEEVKAEEAPAEEAKAEEAPAEEAKAEEAPAEEAKAEEAPAEEAKAEEAPAEEAKAEEAPAEETNEDTPKEEKKG